MRKSLLYSLTISGLITLALPSCKKEGVSYFELQGTWIFTGQYDSPLVASWGPNHFQFSTQYLNYFEFKADRVYANNFATPTWAPLFYNGSSHYTIKNQQIYIADSIISNGQKNYITFPKRFKVISISNNRLVMQYIHPDGGIYTVDTLRRQ